jgi:pilus assembly protein CpaB
MGRRTLVLVVALLLAAVATFAVYNFLSGVEEEAAKDRVYQVVFRTSEGLIEGTQGSAVLEQIRYVESEEETRLVPENVIDSLEELQATLTGRVAAGPISGGQVLTTDQWVEITTEIAPLAGRISEGKEAITVFASAERGVFGFIEPGDRVNVIVTMDLEIEVPIGEETIIGDVQPEEDTTGPTEVTETNTVTKTFTRYVLQGLPVLAIGSEVKPDEDAPVEIIAPTAAAEGEVPAEEAAPGNIVLTLELSPDQAEKMVFAQENGSVWLTLVPPSFVALSDQPTEGVTVEKLYGPEFGFLTKLFPFLVDLEELLLEE